MILNKKFETMIKKFLNDAANKEKLIELVIHGIKAAPTWDTNVDLMTRIMNFVYCNNSVEIPSDERIIKYVTNAYVNQEDPHPIVKVRVVDYNPFTDSICIECIDDEDKSVDYDIKLSYI